MAKRDERGWRIPKEGTLSNTIYKLMVVGMRRSKILAETGAKSTSVGVLMWKIRHPDLANSNTNAYNKRKLGVRSAARTSGSDPDNDSSSLSPPAK